MCCSSVFPASVIERIWSLLLLVLAGIAVYGAVGWLVGAVDKTEINALLRRRKATPQSVSETEASS